MRPKALSYRGPEWAWETIFETLSMDCESKAFDSALRAEIRKAMEALRFQPQPVKRKGRTRSKEEVIHALTIAMDNMQADPELEEVDTLSLMEDAISEAIHYFTGEVRQTRDLDDETIDTGEEDEEEDI